MNDERHLMAALAAPFHPSDVEFKPQGKGDTKAALAYIEARQVMDRMDEVLGVTGWQNEVNFLADGCCVVSIKAHIAGAVIVHQDVGGPGDVVNRKDEDIGNERKAAVSDGLKRAAVHFGVGRYLYNIPRQYCRYANYKWVDEPQLAPEFWPLELRLASKDKKLVEENRCKPGEFVKAVREFAAKAGFHEDMKYWVAKEVIQVYKFVEDFIAKRK